MPSGRTFRTLVFIDWRTEHIISLYRSERDCDIPKMGHLRSTPLRKQRCSSRWHQTVDSGLTLPQSYLKRKLFKARGSEYQVQGHTSKMVEIGWYMKPEEVLNTQTSWLTCMVSYNPVDWPNRYSITARLRIQRMESYQKNMLRSRCEQADS